MSTVEFTQFRDNTDTIERRGAETQTGLGFGAPHTMRGDAQPLDEQQHKVYCLVGH